MIALKLSSILVSILFCIVSTFILAEEGVVGATCSSNPQVFATVDGQYKEIFCYSVEDTFYPGISMLAAKRATIEQCKTANVLDNSGNYHDASDTCYNRCSLDTHCLYGDNR